MQLKPETAAPAIAAEVLRKSRRRSEMFMRASDCPRAQTACGFTLHDWRPADDEKENHMGSADSSNSDQKRALHPLGAAADRHNPGAGDFHETERQHQGDELIE